VEFLTLVSYYLDLLRPRSSSGSLKSATEVSDEVSSKGSPASTVDYFSLQRPSPILYATPSPPDNLTVDTLDSKYLQFFFVQAPMFLLFTHHFPSAPGAIFDLASKHPPTLQAILAVAAQHADMVAGRDRDSTRALVHLSKCLPDIQNALASTDIDEGHIAAVYCLTRLHFARRERITARNHLHGLYLMLEAYQNGQLGYLSHSPSSSPPPYQNPRNPSPFMMFLWRIAIQMDIALGDRGQELVFPSPALNQDDFHRSWISKIASLQATEWALAEFALDDLHHHTLHLQKLANEIRWNSTYRVEIDEPRIQIGVQKLWKMHQKWKTREIVKRAANQEQLYLQKFPIINNEGQFLHYVPPMKFKNEFFVRMLLHHTQRVVQIDLILSPSLQTPSERRVRAAIELCRIIAGVKDMSADFGQYFDALRCAGTVFDPRIYTQGISPYTLN
jgi:Fungal specific transcription factor domain